MKKSVYVTLALTLLPFLVFFLLGYLFPFSIFSNPQSLRNYIQGFGIYSPLVFILINILQVVISPISWPVTSQASGYIFGLWVGFALNWVGRVIGSIIAFYLARQYGKKVVDRFVDNKTVDKLEKMINKGAVYVFLVLTLPSILDDELCWASGLLGMKPKTFFWVTTLGSITGSFAGAYVGSTLAENNIIPFIVNIALVIIGVIVLSQKKKLDKFAEKVKNYSSDLF